MALTCGKGRDGQVRVIGMGALYARHQGDKTIIGGLIGLLDCWAKSIGTQEASFNRRTEFLSGKWAWVSGPKFDTGHS